MTEPTIEVMGSGPRRSLGLEVGGRMLPLIDGATGEPVMFDKGEVIAASYGKRNAAWWAMRALARPEELKTCG